MLYREVDSTCIRHPSQPRAVPADNLRQTTELGFLLDRWSRDVRPFLENACASIEAAPQSDKSGFTFEGTLRIDCHVKGVLPSGEGTLIVGKQGRCEADAFVGTALIKGVVIGNIHASELIEIEGFGRVTGSLEAPAICIGKGAVFEGECNLSEKEVNPQIDRREADNENLAVAAAS